MPLKITEHIDTKHVQAIIETPFGVSNIPNLPIEKVNDAFKEMEQGFLLDRHAVDPKTKKPLLDTLNDLAGKNGWSQIGNISQAIISPDQIPKTRIRITRNGNHVDAVVTFKGKNENKLDNGLKPRFEIDLPIDLVALEKKYANVKKSDGTPWHATDSLDQLIRFGSYGIITKDRYRYQETSDSPTFDIDLYQWENSVLDAVKKAAETALEKTGLFKDRTIDKIAASTQALYENLATLDVEMKVGSDRIGALEDFPERLRPFLMVNGKKNDKPVEVTGASNFKGRSITALAGAAGNFKVDATTCDLIDTLAQTKASKSK